MRPITIYNTDDKETVLLSLVFDQLRRQGFKFTIFSKAPHDRKDGQPLLPNSVSVILILLPLWCIFYLFVFLVRAMSGRSRTLLCFNWPEKVVLTPIAKVLKWRVLWLDLPDSAVPKNFIINRLLARYSRQTEIIVFSRRRGEFWTKQQAQSGIVHVTTPLAYPAALTHQHDLFQALATRPRHRFVIAAVIEDLEKELIERLLSALAIGLTVCSTLELMVIGDGERRKQLLWLIRKMGLGNHVWLVGGAKNFLSWLGHVDMFVLPHEKPSLEEIATTILSMTQGIPIVGPADAGLEEVVTPKFGALIDIRDSEILARQFLRLEQAGETRASIGREAKAQAERLTFEQFVVRFSEILSKE